MNFTFIDMIEETVKFLEGNNIKKAGLLSTSGTARTCIYQETAKAYGIEIILPAEDEIRNEMEAIYGKEGIKAGVRYEKSGKNRSIFLDIIRGFMKEGAAAAIMGCTEIPLCISQDDTSMKLVNPTDVLARSVVDFALR
jgi:aspartate racemase